MSQSHIDPEASRTLEPYLMREESILWAQFSLTSPWSEKLKTRLSQLLWLVVMVVIILFGVSSMIPWFQAPGWPTWGLAFGALCFAGGVSIGYWTIESLFRPSTEGRLAYLISNQRILQFNMRTQDRKSIVGTATLSGAINVQKKTADIGTLTLWCDHPEEEVYLEMHRVRAVDAAERLILESFVRRDKEAEL
ncbi:MAG: hypothetical protein AAFW60_04640 [Pseudomonadota bacterium]